MFFFSSRRRHTRLQGDWSSDVCSSDLDQASDLSNGNVLAGASDDHERISFVVLARFVEIGADEFAGAIHDALNASGHRAPVDVTVEYAHEDRDAGQRPFAKLELRRRHHAQDLTDAAIRGCHHNPLPNRGHSWWIAKKISAPQCRDYAEPAEGRP